MNNLKIYTFSRGITSDRFDYIFQQKLFEHLGGKYKIEWFNFSGDDKFIYKNENDSYQFYDGSTTLFEYENRKIKLLDFGDKPVSTLSFVKFRNFAKAGVAHYNPILWNENEKVTSGILYESFWEFGKTNYESIQSYRKSISLNPNLYWRGTIYNNTGIPRYDGCRYSIPIIKQILKDEFDFNYIKIPFDDYIIESCKYKLVLCFGGGGGYSCGDFCFRDVEMFGIGIPIIRPKFNIRTTNELIPNVHYISVDIDDCLNAEFRIKKEYEIDVANRIASTYKKYINDEDFLKYIAKNAKEWYDNNMTYPTIVNNVIKSLDL